MAVYLQVYDSHYLQADCQEPGSALKPYARQSSMGYLFPSPIDEAGGIMFLSCMSVCVCVLGLRHFQSACC